MRSTLSYQQRSDMITHHHTGQNIPKIRLKNRIILIRAIKRTAFLVTKQTEEQQLHTGALSLA